VTSIEGVNARELSRAQIPELLGCVVADVSFISLKLALPQALALAVPGAWAVLLVKPQFEAGREAIASGGIVRDPAARLAALDGIAAWMETQGWRVVGTMESPIEGGDGNREFLLAARKAE
jgi:23S rRNA (cytidine1920-2'-O)/16S rRNA (cytidine1409-2'-O)-methyltransferase